MRRIILPVLLSMIIALFCGCQGNASETQDTVSENGPPESGFESSSPQSETTIANLKVSLHQEDLLRLWDVDQNCYYEIDPEETMPWQDQNGNPAPYQQFSLNKWVTLTYIGEAEGPFPTSAGDRQRYTLTASQVVSIRVQEDAQELVQPFQDLNLEEIERMEVMLNAKDPPDYQQLSPLETAWAVEQLNTLIGTRQPNPDLETLMVGGPSTLRITFTDQSQMELRFLGTNYDLQVTAPEGTAYYCMLYPDYEPLLNLNSLILGF